jgi:hypothetical protein
VTTMPETITTLPPITRPNGKLYQPRKITANAVGDENEALCGVIVLGTHDEDQAKPLADDYVRWQLGAGCGAASPERGWYRIALRHGDRQWITDELRGAAGIWFTEIAEVPL